MRIFGFISLSLYTLSGYVLPTSAIHASEAGIIDWYKPLIGDALTGNSALAPVFHRIGVESKSGPTRSLVLTGTTSNVLAALHPENGTLAWRYLYEDNDQLLAFKKHRDVIATLSGTGGAMLRLLEIETGQLLHERQLHKPDAGRLVEPANTGLSIAFDSTSSSYVYVLTNGHTLRRVSTSTGEVQWGWTAPDETSLVIYSKVVSTSSAVYVLGLAKSFASYTLHLTALDPTTGELLASADVNSSITSGPESFFTLSSDELSRALWVENGAIKTVTLTPELKEKPALLKGTPYVQLIDAGLSDHGLIVALKEKGASAVLKSTQSGLEAIWEFADSARASHYTESIFSGGFDHSGHPYLARLFWSHGYKKASAHVFAPHLADGKGLVTGFTFPFDTNAHGIVGGFAVDAANPEEFRVLARVVVATTTGALQLWQQDQVQWTREEGLADIRVAEFVELPERKVTTSGNEDPESFGVRLARQLSEARNFPAYLVGFTKRFVTGSYESVSSSLPAADEASGLTRDAFGFRKILVVATGSGKLYGLDSASGEIVWSRVFGLGWAAEVGARVIPIKAFTVKGVAEGEPQVVIVTQRKAMNGLLDTVLFHVNALTGEDAANSSSTDGVLNGLDIIAGPLVEAYLLKDKTSRYVVLFDEFLQAHTYPETSAHSSSLAKLVPRLRFALRTGTVGATRLTGHFLSPNKEFTDRYVAHPAWTLSLPPQEDILHVIPKSQEPIASLGKVLGNRTTLYKYLSPNVVTVLTQSVKSSPPSCGVYIVDAVKGSIVYHAVLPAQEGTCDVQATMADNWLVYHYWDGEAVGADQAKSYRVVSVEFYEGGIDEKSSSSDSSSYSEDSIKVNAVEQTYVFPRGVTALATTTTKFGISSKDIIVAGENGIIQAFPRRFLDPRRPKRKPTSEEQEEWLVQYDPLVPDDPKRVLSHNYQVAKTRAIITSPALLESTSLVFAYGLDLFSTRIAPSNTFDVLSESFNKAQLVFTIGGLALAIVITKPMVKRKKLRERWYD